MENLLGQLQSFPSWKEVLRVSCRSNALKTCLANSLTPIKIKSLYGRLVKAYQYNPQKARFSWFENQLKAYHWVLIAISAIEDVLINDFTQTQWTLLSTIFHNKQTYVLQYQAIRLSSKKALLNRFWVKQQQEILKEVIIGKQTQNKWNDVARSLFKQSSNKFYRTGKQCRERWLNHLDPKKKRGQWSIDEDKCISNYILEQGKKWSQISRVLGHSRTEHMVKNRFKSLIIRQKKYYPRVSSESELLKSILNEDHIKRQSISSIQEDSQQYGEIKNQQNDQPQQQENNQEPQQENRSFVHIPKANKKTVSKGFSIVPIPSGSEFNKNNITNIYQLQKSQRSILSPGCSLAELDYILRAEIIQKNNINTEAKQQNRNQTFELQQIFSPFCVAYTPNGNLTPIYSPPPSIPFFMGFKQRSFGQGCINNFGFFMEQNQGQQGNNGAKNE